MSGTRSNPNRGKSPPPRGAPPVRAALGGNALFPLAPYPMSYAVTINFPTTDEVLFYGVLERRFDTKEDAKSYYEQLRPYVDFGILTFEEREGDGETDSVTELEQYISEATVAEFPHVATMQSHIVSK